MNTARTFCAARRRHQHESNSRIDRMMNVVCIISEKVERAARRRVMAEHRAEILARRRAIREAKS